MGHVRMTTHSDAPIERVFELVLDAKRLPEWNTSFNEIKDISGPFDRIGTTAEVVMKVWGRPITGRIEVTDVVRPTLLTVVGSAPGGGKMTWTQRFTPAGTGTDAEMEIDYELPAGFLGAMADKLFVEQAIERDARHSAENFKALVEATTPVPA